MKLPETLQLATEESYLRAVDGRRVRPTRAILTFLVASETYGVDILDIREIIKMREITEVPRMPKFLLGVISVRGTIIPVIDLRLRLRLVAAPPTRAARVLVVVHEGELFGLQVDAVVGVMRLGESEIEMPPSGFADDNFLGGIGRYRSGRKDRLVVLLNLQAAVGFDHGRRSQSQLQHQAAQSKNSESKAKAPPKPRGNS